MSQSLFINPTAVEAGLEAAFRARASANEAQRAAFARFGLNGLPHRRVEGWRWSDFAAALRDLKASDAKAEAPSHIAPSVFASLKPIEFQLIDGRIHSPEDVSVRGLEFGVIDAAGAHPAFDNHGIVSLNIAMTSKALGIGLAPNVQLRRPILIRHINTGAAPTFTQVLARAEASAEMTIIETFEGESAFSSAMFQIAVQDHARVRRYMLQDMTPNSIVHGFMGAMIDESACLDQVSLSTGGRLCRHESHLRFSAREAQANLASAALVDGDKHADFTSLVCFSQEQGNVRQLHKGVARENGRTVFQGKFLVERAAQKTDAQMTANALLLSDRAEANHKPELEIYADDVECAHGSTSGALDDDALFYLRQRGLSEHEARALLTDAFVSEAIDQIEDEGVRAVFAARVAKWLVGVTL